MPRTKTPDQNTDRIPERSPRGRSFCFAPDCSRMAVTHSSKFCGLLLIQTWSRLMKRPSSKARDKAPRPKPFENNKVDFSKFKTDPSMSDIARLLTADIKGWPWPWVIEVLSPTKTIGRGRTNLELLLPLGGELHTDATGP